MTCKILHEVWETWGRVLFALCILVDFPTTNYTIDARSLHRPPSTLLGCLPLWRSVFGFGDFTNRRYDQVAIGDACMQIELGIEVAYDLSGRIGPT